MSRADLRAGEDGSANRRADLRAGVVAIHLAMSCVAVSGRKNNG